MQLLKLLEQATSRLAAETARLDAELLLAEVLGVSRSYLRTWPDKALSADEAESFEKLVQRRERGEPVAYILGKQGFWSLDLEVSPHTLIPRPDTETLVEYALGLNMAERARVLDLGTGTGAIALAVARERPHWQVLAVDRVPEAVALAKKNAGRLGLLNVTVQQSDWFASLAGMRFDMILGNPPYIAPDDPHLELGDVRFEPRSALVAERQGFSDLQMIIRQAPEFLLSNGVLMLEHGFDQGATVKDLMEDQGYEQVSVLKDLSGNERVTIGHRGQDAVK